ncbi:hypothetical protein [Plantactinospora endophytica]|uniref:Secreted protein/lipoprotein n=1 Tax=Plantactinospora endophytica TaxID=673535 RepID=A0ABQ4E276_9ACTN|nr:hypothetical protein [Plantactinospora endophytica]GIG88810.1 hypothetical protein Pen02_37460 [Plantactinospora endophytica]
MRTRQPAYLWAALLGLALVFGGTGCGNRPGSAAPRDSDAAPAASPDTRGAEAEKSALAAYAGYLTAVRKAEQSGDPLDPQLRKYLADPLLTRVRLTIRDAKEHGAMRTGKLVSNPSVTAVDLDSDPATVSIQDCIDATGYRLVYKKDKKVVPGSAGSRHLATATATRYPDGRWLINVGASHEDQPC